MRLHARPYMAHPEPDRESVLAQAAVLLIGLLVVLFVVTVWAPA